MVDDHIRREALNPHQSFIVQAPAGSGKTQLLTSRLLSLLACRVTTPESILAITFTRKAAQEMKRRVIHALQLARGPEPQTDHERSLWQLAKAVLQKDEQYGWGLLMNPQRLRIMTIDALCSSVTHQLPLSSRLGADPTCVEYAGSLYLQAAQETIRQLLGAQHPSIKTLLLHLHNRQTLACEMLANMLASREQWFGLIYSREMLEDSIALVAQNTFEKIMSDLWGVDWDGLSLYQLYASSHIDLPSHAELSPDIVHLDQWRAITRWLCTTEGEVRKVVDKRQGFPAASSFKNKDEAAEAKAMKEGFMMWMEHLREDTQATAALKELMSLPDPHYPDQQWEVLQALLEVLPKAVEQLYLLFEARSETDFNAIARCALTALGGEDNPTDLDLKLDHAIHHILVDEFQDTSASQFELIRRLVAHWDNSGEKTLFLVGDPMQSIYGFRQAEVGGFLQAQQYGMGPVLLRCLHLRANFRSEKSIIDWINRYMPSVFAPQDDIYLGAIQYAPFEAQHASEEDSGVFPIWVSDDNALNESVVSTLRSLIDDQAITSIAILVRQRNHIQTIAPALRQACIAYQAVEIEKITQTPCVRQLLQLTRAYLNRADQQAWLGVLMSPYCGLSLADLTLLHESFSLYSEALSAWQSVSGLSDHGVSILNRVAPILTDALSHQYRLPLAKAIEGLWYALGGPASLQYAGQSLDAEPFFSLLLACDEGGTLNLIEFEKRLDMLFSQASSSAKIQIMTIHRAKGLEFDAVLIPSLERQPRASEKPLLLWEACPIDDSHVFLFAPIHAVQEDRDPIYEFIWRKHKIRERHEQARLLYVALTRAKKKLYLFAEKVKPRQDSFLSMLHTAFESTPDPVEPSQLLDDYSHQSINDLHRLDPHWQHPYLETLLQAHQMAKACQSNPIDHETFLPSRVAEKALGTIVHHILYLWAEDPALMSLAIESQATHWMALLNEHGLLISHIDWLKTVMQRVQADPRAHYILSPHQDAHNEYEINHLIDGEIHAIVIDRMFIDDAGVRVIVDYKTGQLDQEAYWYQLDSYARVMQTLETRPIRQCLYSPVTGESLERVFDSCVCSITPI